ncbi:unnamed protein product, partial [Mesorhabditis spiculigera]
MVSFDNKSLLEINSEQLEDKIVIYTATAIWVVILILGLITVNLFLYVLYRGRKTFVEYPFFLIVRHLVIINNIHLLAQATLVLPLMVIVYTEETNGIFYLWSTIGTQVTKFTGEDACL